MSKAAEDLKKEFGTRYPKLEQVTARFLGIEDIKTAYKYHNRGEIPFPAFRLSRSSRAPLLVDVEVLAKIFDEESLKAIEVKKC